MAKSESQQETGKDVAPLPLFERLGLAKGLGNERANRMGNREILCKRLQKRGFFNTNASLTGKAPV